MPVFEGNVKRIGWIVIVSGLSCVLLLSLGGIGTGTVETPIYQNEKLQIQTNGTSDTVQKELVSARGTEFDVKFYRSNFTVDIKAYNPTERDRTPALRTSVNKIRAHKIDFELAEGESWETKLNFTPHLDVMSNEQRIAISTTGNYTLFNETREIAPDETDEIPHTRITDVSLERKTIGGNETAVANVTVENPSIHPYTEALMVHTVNSTNGTLRSASVPPNESRTVIVELEEDPGDRIAGEARLYGQNISKYENGFHQVEFSGRVDGETHVSNQTYDPITPFWDGGDYRYRNESIPTATPTEDTNSSSAGAGWKLPMAIAVVLLLVILARR